MIEKLWPACDVVVIAGGPSLTAADVDACRGRARVVVVNDGYRLAPWADVLYAADPEWWAAHQGVPGFAGIKVSQNAKAAAKWGLRHVASVNEPGLSLDRSVIHQGQTSGYQAINLAVHLGAVRILLLGFDMKLGEGGAKHWFGDHPGELNKAGNYAGWVKNFPAMVPDLAKAGVEVVNCSRETAIDCFPRMPIGQALGIGNS